MEWLGTEPARLQFHAHGKLGILYPFANKKRGGDGG